MGLFDKVKGVKEAENTKLTKEESFAAVALAAVAADGMITEEEANGLVVSLVRMKLFSGYNSNQMGAMLNKLVQIIKKQGVDELVNMAKESLAEGPEGDRVRGRHRPRIGRRGAGREGEGDPHQDPADPGDPRGQGGHDNRGHTHQEQGLNLFNKWSRGPSSFLFSDLGIEPAYLQTTEQ